MEGEGGLQLCVHEVDQDHQEGLVSAVCVHEVDRDHQEGLVSAASESGGMIHQLS